MDGVKVILEPARRLETVFWRKQKSRMDIKSRLYIANRIPTYKSLPIDDSNHSEDLRLIITW